MPGGAPLDVDLHLAFHGGGHPGRVFGDDGLIAGTRQELAAEAWTE